MMAVGNNRGYYPRRCVDGIKILAPTGGKMQIQYSFGKHAPLRMDGFGKVACSQAAWILDNRGSDTAREHPSALEGDDSLPMTVHLSLLFD